MALAKPYFSVIIPMFDREAYIGETIESVLRQTFSSFEVIVIDDGSTDNSLSIVKTYEYDERVVLVQQKNRGRCAARNHGLEIAQGDWICFLDSDDLYNASHLNLLYSLTSNRTEFKAFATEQTMGGNRKQYPLKKFARPEFVLDFKHFIRHNPISLNQLCIKAELAPSFPDERLAMAEDWFYLRSVAFYNRIYKVDIVTTDVRLHHNRTMTTASPEMFVKFNLRSGNLVCKALPLTTIASKKILAHIHLLCANVLLNQGLRKEANSLLSSSYNFFPQNIQPLLWLAYFKAIFR